MNRPWTPGPWWVCDGEECGNPLCDGIYTPEGRGVLTLDDDVVVRANAVLMAAAPDLFEALQDYVNAPEDSHPMAAQARRRKALAALAKALGEDKT